MNVLRTSALVAVAAFAVTAEAAAQAKCDINQGSPFQLNSAKIYLNKAQSSSGKVDEKAKHLQSSVKVLTDNPEKINNAVGRNWLLGKTLIIWTQQPNTGYVVKRGAIGYTQNPDATVDLLAAADSAFDAVEAAKPECADSVSVYRRQPWTKLVNQSIEALNANKTDSAEAYARQALMIYDKGPHAHSTLATIAQQKNDYAGALQHYKNAIAAAGTDTAFAKMRQVSMYNVAVLTQQQAEAADAAQKAALNKEAAALFQAYLKEVPNDANAQSGLARALGASGDTAAVQGIYTKMLADPSGYTDIQLFEAGSNAARANQNKEAATLLEAGLKKNPYYRDALFNLANVYFTLEDAEKMAPVVKRLVEVDPNSPENWRLVAGNYQLKQKAAKAGTAAKKAYTDSLLQNLQKSEKMPVRVSVREFTHAGAKHTLGGMIENLGDKPMANVALKIEFLDATGNVVTTQTASVPQVAPKSSQSFRVEAEQNGIVAYRYAPITGG